MVDTGSCALHTASNAFKQAFGCWSVDVVLRSLHRLFYKTPARREDYVKVQKETDPDASIVFPEMLLGALGGKSGKFFHLLLSIP